jgi:NAD(P)-dependent dehydrogenase (short-subunit alcohol dehydrogenase family)
MDLPWAQTCDGYEQQWQVNYLSHVLLTHLLMIPLQQSSSPLFQSRIINVSSLAHKRVTAPLDFDSILTETAATADKYVFSLIYFLNNLLIFVMTMCHRKAPYGRSKLAQIYFASELARRLSTTSIITASLHPGHVFTNLVSNAG